jgi:hypothetical protein
MTTRMQQRRGTSTQWTSADPILAAGEIGVETDTNQFKLGDGVNVWSELSYFKNLEDLGASLDDYVSLSSKGQPNGVAQLDSNGQVPVSQLSNLIDGAPLALNTLNELAAAINNDASFTTTILAAVGQKVNASVFTEHTDKTTSVHGIADTSALATKTYADTKASDAQSAATSTASADATTKADQAKSQAISAAATDATAKVAAETTARTTAIATAKSEAISSAATAADTKVSTHNSETTNVHGIADTSALALTATVNSALALKAPLASPTFTGTVSGVTKAHVGLENVDNTSDTNKPVSSAVTTALGLKAPVASPTFTGTVTIPAGASISGFAPLASPALTGTPTAPTAAAGTSTTQVATTAFVGTAVSNLVASAPAALDTLNELATALGNDANFSTTLTTNLGLKAPKADPTFTGTVTVSASGIAFSDGTQTKAGVPSITNIPTALAAGAQAIASGRADQFIPLTGAVVITLPATGYSTGQSIDFYQESSTGAYFAQTNGVVGTPGLKFRTTNSVATAMKTSSGWLVFGDLSA